MFTDDIAALATPPGRSAVALVRVSGPGAAAIGERILDGFAPTPPRRVRLAKVIHPDTGQVVDETLYTFFEGPASYTGEDVLEISTHGGLLAPVEVLECALRAGARAAHPGEFTRRAVLLGKLDLLQAEAIGDLIDATAPHQRRAALHQLDRGLSRRIEQLRADVLALDAMVCYEVDFPEEDEGPIAPERIDEATERLLASFHALLQTSSDGARLREGATVVVAGRPNTGKSSLFNALLGAERAIVTELAGTTRDAIEAPITCEGFPFRLVDTAGLRDTDDRVERLGIEVSHRYLHAADVILFCVETGRDMDGMEREFVDAQSAPVLVTRTKADLTPVVATAEGHVAVSAETGEGLSHLRVRLARLAFAGLLDGSDIEPLVTRARHRVALSHAVDEVTGFQTARASGLESAVAAVHLHAAVSALEDVIGVVTQDEVLARVFSTFCVGK